MGKLDKTLRAAGSNSGVQGVIRSELIASGKTGNGGEGFARDAKSELFLLAVANFVGEDTFYEDAKGRDARFRDLVRAAALQDSQWVRDLFVWLRSVANMRTASIVGGIEAAKAISDKRKSLTLSAGWDFVVQPRELVASVLQRADEPGEALAYWLATYGKPLPKWLKRGLGDAIVRLYTPYSVLKWDSDRNEVRFADVLEYTQIARGRGIPKEDLFTFLLDRRHQRANWHMIPMFAARKQFDAIPVADRRDYLANSPHFVDAMRAAGVTWEHLSGWIQAPMDATVWERLIDGDQMGYMALLRNLRNFDQAGISTAHRKKVAAILTDPARVETSRQLPMRFLSAYNAAPSDFWKPVLYEAATHALRNVPRLAGRTLVLIDTSGSMDSPFTTHSGRANPQVEPLKRWDVAALFGIALGKAAENADVVSYSGSSWPQRWSQLRAVSGSRPSSTSDSKQFDLPAGENLLKAVARFRTTHFLNGGTDTAAAVHDWYAGHDRVVLLTDEQANYDVAGMFAAVPPTVPTYTFNLAGYKYGHAPSGPNRLVVGGLSDAGFQMISALEQHGRGSWPWQD